MHADAVSRIKTNTYETNSIINNTRDINTTSFEYLKVFATNPENFRQPEIIPRQVLFKEISKVVQITHSILSHFN